MDIFSLDILKLAQIFLSPWRWLRRRTSRSGEEILRRDVEGLEIVVVNRTGTVITSSVEVKTIRIPSEEHGTVESASINIEVERSI